MLPRNKCVSVPGIGDLRLDTCYSPLKTQCLIRAINKMVDTYYHKAWRDNYQWHCELYGSNGVHEDCARALTEEGLYQSLRGNVDRILEECNRL